MSEAKNFLEMFLATSSSVEHIIW